MADPVAANLRRLAGLLFDQAAHRWYVALGLEAVSVVCSGIAATFISGGAAAFAAIVGLVLLVPAYALRLDAESRHEAAQTMNRQAALSDGLGWPLDAAQLDDWRRRVGAKKLAEADTSPLDPTYYASTEAPGAKRLAEMKLESAFYTRCLWLEMRRVLTTVLLAIGVVGCVAVYVVFALPTDAGVVTVAAQVLATAVLIAIGADMLGWIVRLGRQAAALQMVIIGLDRVLQQRTVKPEPVLRLVSEYDCEMVASMPIHKRFFDWKHYAIDDLWRRRSKPSRFQGDIDTTTPPRSRRRP